MNKCSVCGSTGHNAKMHRRCDRGHRRRLTAITKMLRELQDLLRSAS
jgi:hypothetical protein